MFGRAARGGITSSASIEFQRRSLAIEALQGRRAPAVPRGGGIAVATRPIPALQILRALAALSVIYAHIRYDFSVKFGIAEFPPRIAPLDAGVDVFFVISGFVMVYASERLFKRGAGPREFLARRILRIVPLYWLTSLTALAYILVRQRTSDLLPHAVFYKWAAASFLFIPYARTNGELSPLNGVGWTLNYEMLFYAVFAAAVCLSRRAAIAGIALLFAAMVLAGLHFAPLPDPFGFWCDPLILEFVFGMLIALALREGLRLPSWLAHGVILGGLAALLVEQHLAVAMSRVLQYGVPSALIVAGLALNPSALGAAGSGLFARAFGFLGNASYSIYLVHPFALTAPRLLHFGLAGDGTAPPSQPWLYASLQLATALAAGVIVHLGVERPITRALRRKWESVF
jgi:exopolysaccharide production protein ExoZ